MHCPLHQFNQRANVITGTISTVRTVTAGALIAILMCVGAAPSFAEHSGTADEQQACTPDVFRLCSAQIPSETRIVACLNKNMAKLSPACRAVMRGDSQKSKSREKR
jgi:hypothetical protein